MQPHLTIAMPEHLNMPGSRPSSDMHLTLPSDAAFFFACVTQRREDPGEALADIEMDRHTITSLVWPPDARKSTGSEV